ncbi:hypothetical protein SAMN05216559_1959 [Halomicrobium zhouii]|uniref:Uncharacterized protein n=1 Tax=Halomicrobium zhouii TaxID=767519 RepID=A0A1I6L3I3_9EURY|nr:hypothetical protein [Halomicrobium zhouii]SFR98021.1 hypothetical protein SAMN05216559_1959 [Halomicrobium zhouii]
MGRRLTTELDPYGPLADKRYERDPPVMDAIKIDGTLTKQILLVSEELGVDGERIVELLGAPRNGGAPEPEHEIAGAQQEKLRDLIAELLIEIEDYVDPDEDIAELATEVHPRDKALVEPTDDVFLGVYGKLRSVRILHDFAIEHDIELSIG